MRTSRGPEISLQPATKLGFDLRREPIEAAELDRCR